MGVFLDGAEPVDPPPATIDFTNNHEFTDLSPELRQLFFIGSGRNSAGTRQKFHSPAGATRLFLGFADGPGPPGPHAEGPPGAYDDNSGSLTVAVGSTEQPTGGTNPAPQGYLPSVNGWQIQNTGDASVGYDRMATYYPASAPAMYFLGDTRQHSYEGQWFYDTLFQPAFTGGICYGLATSSVDAYNNTAQPRLVDNALSDAGVKDTIEQFHARQLGAMGVQRALESWLTTSGLPSGARGGNDIAWETVAVAVQTRPILLAIGPYAGLSAGQFVDDFNMSHAVVAYGASRFGDGQGSLSGGNIWTIKVYDPNAPKDDHARIELDFSTKPVGIRLISNGTVSYGNGMNLGQPNDWVLMPTKSDAYGAAGNTSWFLGTTAIPIAHTTILASAPDQRVGHPVFQFDGNGMPGPYTEELAAGQTYQAILTNSGPNPEIAEVAGNHLVVETAQGQITSGTVHQVTIAPDATSMTLAGATAPEQYELRLAADYHSYGRQFSLTGWNLAPGTTDKVEVDPAINTLSITTNGGVEQHVHLQIDQHGSNASTISVSVVVPPSGNTTINLSDWSHLNDSHVSETIDTPTGHRVLNLHGPPATTPHKSILLPIAILAVGSALAVGAVIALGKQRRHRRGRLSR